MGDRTDTGGRRADDRTVPRGGRRRSGLRSEVRRGTTRPAAERAAAVPAPSVVRRPAARVALSALVMTFAAGLVATLALPSYAFDPTKAGEGTVVAGRTVSKSGEQRFAAPGDLAAADLSRDSFKATSSAELLRAAYATKFSAYSGPSAEDYLKNPAHPAFSLDAVYSTALQYQGVPYVFGGADPSGFDCSGFIMFVYAQYGVDLPHSVHQQNMIGTPISQADAQPGDVVMFNDNSHDGFYAGDGMILHAPYPGASVRVQKLWTSNVHFVRFGI